ncbi:NAD-dependent epimerase/dehydratase family protein [Fonticella tunisiensis]|uniref:Nucleoside-diphosphate-sugar epimerase n=1 Tax=Fonticella tunisiensis TaxID=1096341 RepID=A0A4R7KPG9_9CLOT|nr:SDR family NAD(P)-dependent oxidoreductase [Fonticella tunisiensis]TDT61029.1 nucleoside-diphosphate-sugar epimerase [Fonticella tunisiensis]
MSKKALITGAAGFAGACLAENLVKEGYEVNIIARSTSNMWRLKRIIKEIRVFEADICDEYSIDKALSKIKPEYIFHLAAYGAYYYQEDAKKIINTNIIGTVNLVNACLKVDFKSFINFGSSSEYGIKNEPMKETDVLEPVNTYGFAKASQSLYCQMAARTFNLPIATIRPFSLFGYYEDKTRLVPSVVLSCLRGRNPKLSNKNAVRDFIFIEDLIELTKILSECKSLSGKIYNCGLGKQHTVEEMASTIIQESGSKVTPIWGALPDRKVQASKWEADMSLVKKELNWEPKFTLREGVRKTIEWFKNNIDLYEGM